MTSQAKSMCFTITGEALTRTARGLMLDGDPGKAYRLIADGLIGITDNLVHELLDGEQDLTGDSNVGVDVRPAEDGPELQDYIRNIRYIYAGRVRLGGRWYRPRGVVESFGIVDAKHAGPMPTKLDKPAFSAWCRRRSEFYVGPGERLEAVLTDRGESHVIFEPCGDPPQWRQPSRDAQAAYDDAIAAGRHIEGIQAAARGPVYEARQLAGERDLDAEEADRLQDLAYAAEDEAFAHQCAELGARVREQAGEDLFEMILQDGSSVQVPCVPFIRWALRGLEGVELPDWRAVSPSGLKMQNDSTDHTDWMLGAGLDLKDGYEDNINKPAWKHATHIQIEMVDRD